MYYECYYLLNVRNIVDINNFLKFSEKRTNVWRNFRIRSVWKFLKFNIFL